MGFEGADLGEDCGRYGSSNVTITTGPAAGSVLEGQCGRCDGLANVDSLGVYEFDTATDKIVGNHVMPDGTGGDPFGSPDGRHVVLVGRNGGQVIRILKAGVNGAISTVAIDLELGFSTVDEETSVVYNDFAFIQTAVDDDIMNTGIARDLIVIESERKYEDIARKHNNLDAESMRANERADNEEKKINELEDELKVVGQNLQQLEVSEEKAMAREETYQKQIRELMIRLKAAETQAENSEMNIQRLNIRIDQIEDELIHEKLKIKAISDDVDGTFKQMAYI